MSRIFDLDGFKVLWGSIIKEEKIDLAKFPIIPIGQGEPVNAIPELGPFVDQIIKWSEDFTSNKELNPVVASSWIIAFDPDSDGLDIHTDDDHGGTVNVVVWFEGEEGHGGNLELWDPRWVNPKLWGGAKGDGKYIIPFELGKVVMFPSNVWHRVTPYTGSKQRRSLNMILSFKNIKQLALEDVCTSQLIELGEKYNYSYDGSLESLLELIQVLKSKL